MCEALENNPLSRLELAAAVQADPYFLKTERLEREGYLLRCGLTPTDIMHIRGDYTAFCADAAQLGADFLACRANISTEELCDWVYHEVKKTLFLHISKMLMEEEFPQLAKEGFNKQLELLLIRAWEQRTGHRPSQWNIGFHTPSKLIGVGAPIHIFLPEVAKALGTSCIIPPHANVVNALGAASCSITAEKFIRITEKNSSYLVWAEEDAKPFKVLDDAVAAAKIAAEKLAEEEIRSRGATGEILYRHETQVREVPSGYGGMLFISAEVRVTAISGFSL